MSLIKYLPLVFILLIFSCKNKDKSKGPKPSPPVVVDVLVARPQQIDNDLEVNGTVIANEFVELRPEISGRLTYLNVPEGNYVTQGTVIARINDADLRAQLSKIKAQLSLAEKTVDRYRQLLDINGINQSDYDVAVNTVSSYKADLAYTQAQLDKTVIRAPFSGTVGLKQVSMGAYVTSSNVIATIQQTDKVKIDFTLPDIYSGIVEKGTEVSIVSTDSTTDKSLKAQVIAIEPQVIVSSRSLKVRALLENKTVHPGSFVKVIVDAGTDNNAILVPTSAIIPNDKNKQLVVVKNGKSEFVTVKTGLRLEDKVAIVEGLAEGDSVVVTGVLFAKKGAIVKVRSAK